MKEKTLKSVMREDVHQSGQRKGHQDRETDQRRGQNRGQKPKRKEFKTPTLQEPPKSLQMWRHLSVKALSCNFKSALLNNWGMTDPEAVLS